MNLIAFFKFNCLNLFIPFFAVLNLVLQKI